MQTTDGKEVIDKSKLIRIHINIFREDKAYLKKISRFHGETSQILRNLTNLYCKKLRSGQMDQEDALKDVFKEEV